MRTEFVTTRTVQTTLILSPHHQWLYSDLEKIFSGMCGRPPFGKGYLMFWRWSGAVMCPAC